MSPAQPLSVLIIGCGNIAGGFDAGRPEHAWPLTHAGAFQRHGGYLIKACIEPDTEKRRAFMARWQVEEGAATLNDLALTPQQFDVVSICSPTASHHADIQGALSLAPRLLFCEKPVSSTVAETEDIIGQCRELEVKLAVNHTRRWAPDIWALREQLHQGHWGKIRSAAGRYSKGVLNNGAHMIDLLLFLLGNITPRWAGPPVYDFWSDDPTVPAALVSDEGVPILLYTANAGDFSTFELVLVTERGVVAMEDGGATWRTRATIDSSTFAGYKSLDSSVARPGEYDRAMSNAVSNIYEAIRFDAPLLSTGQTALEAQRICAAIGEMAAKMSGDQS